MQRSAPSIAGTSLPGTGPPPAGRSREPRPRRVPAPRLYVYFDAIVRHGSIRRAAETLGIASSALNRRLLDLEQDIGSPLFDRLQTGVRLTPAGEVFAAHVRRTLMDAEQAGGLLEELDGAMSGPVAIGSAESAAMDFLPAMIADFGREAPGIRFSLAVGAPLDLLHDLLADRLDLILTHEEPNRHDVAVVASAPKTFCALMRPGHPLGVCTPLAIADCLEYPIVLAEKNLAARALVDATLGGRAGRIRPVLVTNIFEVMKQYVRVTDAISFQFHLDVSHAPDGLIAVPLADPQVAPARLTLALRRGRALPARVAAVCARMKTILEHAALR